MALPPPKRVKLEAFYPVWGRNNYPQWSGTRPAEAGDKVPVRELYTIGGEHITSEERRAQMGNPFVIEAKLRFDNVLSDIDWFSHQQKVIDDLEQQLSVDDKDQARIIEAQLKNTELYLDNRESFLVGDLSKLKNWSEEYGVTEETNAFFADYGEYEKGTRLSLKKLYDMFDVA